MKLAIVGSRAFTDVEKVVEVVEKYIAQYGESLVIASGGAKGADAIGKEVALRNGIKYIEFPPAHQTHNEYCLLPAEHYGQPYKVTNFFERNAQIAEYVDHVAAFVVEGIECNGTMNTVEKARSLGRSVFIFTQTGF